MVLTKHTWNPQHQGELFETQEEKGSRNDYPLFPSTEPVLRGSPDPNSSPFSDPTGTTSFLLGTRVRFPLLSSFLPPLLQTTFPVYPPLLNPPATFVLPLTSVSVLQLSFPDPLGVRLRTVPDPTVKGYSKTTGPSFFS